MIFDAFELRPDVTHLKLTYLIWGPWRRWSANNDMLVNFDLFLIQNYWMTSEHLEYIVWVMWTTAMVLFGAFFFFKLDNPNFYSLSLYVKVLPGYSSKFPLYFPQKNMGIWVKNNMRVRELHFLCELSSIYIGFDIYHLPFNHYAEMQGDDTSSLI